VVTGGAVVAGSVGAAVLAAGASVDVGAVVVAADALLAESGVLLLQALRISTVRSSMDSKMCVFFIIGLFLQLGKTMKKRLPLLGNRRFPS